VPIAAPWGDLCVSAIVGEYSGPLSSVRVADFGNGVLHSTKIIRLVAFQSQHSCPAAVHCWQTL
jgi:hypothetical protein